MSLDWDNDPELKAIRDEFVRSLADREKALIEALSSLSEDPAGGLRDIQHVAHKLAGTASSYGFPSLTRFGELVDDRLDALFSTSAGGTELAKEGEVAKKYARALADALKKAHASGKDDPAILATDGAKSLISAGG
ncbi:MAG TPA: Hpt domain-containing protein [Bdellovibrionota bacterium]|jgi:HPt (histidine-containing phosphotransfer) domain-containing protein|nr:Hpt domain-containing protein [Bdellovibrionota bacterium]